VQPNVRFLGYNAPNSISAGAPLQTALGELTALLPQTLAVFKWPTSKGREGKGRERKRGGEGSSNTFYTYENEIYQK